MSILKVLELDRAQLNEVSFNKKRAYIIIIRYRVADPGLNLLF